MPMKKEKLYYFGCVHPQGGHYLIDDTSEFIVYSRLTSGTVMPWRRIDTDLCAKDKTQVECEMTIHKLKGWTALAFWDRSVDSRPGSNSAFFINRDVDSEELLEKAREKFKFVFDRLKHPLKLVYECVTVCHPYDHRFAIVEEKTRIISVCSACKQASCWLGIFMCEDSRDAGIVSYPESALISFQLEHPDYWLTDDENADGLSPGKQKRVGIQKAAADAWAARLKERSEEMQEAARLERLRDTSGKTGV